MSVPPLTMSVDRQSPEWWPNKIPRPPPERPKEHLQRWEEVKGPGREVLQSHATDGMPTAFELTEIYAALGSCRGVGLS